MSLLLLFIRYVVCGVCSPYFGDLTQAEIDDGIKESLAYSEFYHANPLVLENPYHPHNGFESLPRLPVVKINTSRVVLADYTLLKQDFPFLRSMRETEIDAWILERTSWVHAEGMTNIVHNIANHVDIEASKSPPDAARLSAIATRSMTIDVGAQARSRGQFLMESKGSGKVNDVRDGLSTLHDRVTEFVHDKMINLIMKHAGLKQRTIGHYAVVSYGFRYTMLHTGDTYDAAYTLRQISKRSMLPFGILPTHQQVAFELRARQYGWTSIGEDKAKELIDAAGDHDCRPIHWQGTVDHDVLDLDTFTALEESFRRPLCVMLDCFPQCHEVVNTSNASYVHSAVDPKYNNGLGLLRIMPKEQSGVDFSAYTYLKH